MERQRNKNLRYFLLFICILTAINTFSQGVYKPIFYQAFIGNRMDTWESTMIQLEKEVSQKQDVLLTYDLVVAQYGYIAWCLGNKNNKKAETILSKAEKNLDRLMDKRKNWAELYAFQASFWGFRIAISNAKAVYLGPRSLKAINKAVELNKHSPVVWLEKGNSLYYRPAIVGGSKTEAVDCYNTSVRLFESTPNTLQDNWLYLNAMTTLARSYEETGNITKARTTYEKILKFEPNYKWVKEELYPRLMKKTKD